MRNKLTNRLVEMHTFADKLAESNRLLDSFDELMAHSSADDIIFSFQEVSDLMLAISMVISVKQKQKDADIVKGEMEKLYMSLKDGELFSIPEFSKQLQQKIDNTLV